MPDMLERLAETIAARRHASAEDRVGSLFAGGLPHIARALGAVASETVVAALAGDPRALTAATADLLLHLLVLLEKRGVAVADILAELDRRENASVLADPAAQAITPEPTPSPVEAEPLMLDAEVALPLLDAAETTPLLAMGGAPAPRKRIRRG